MNIIAWCLSLAFLVLTLSEAVVFYKATVCRQEAWLLAFHLKTKSILNVNTTQAHQFHPRCQLWVKESSKIVYWRKNISLQKHPFELPIKGHL
jgi:hypothetical protein